MFFEKVHEVGNRSRWKTRQTVSVPSMKLIADEIEALKGITGLYANARTGTIIVTVEDLEARATLDQYFVYLQTHAPIYRLDPSHKIAAFQESKSKPKTPATYGKGARRNRAITGQPINLLVGKLAGFVRKMPLMHPTLPIRRSIAQLAQTRLDRFNDDGRLDFSPLAHFVFLRPFLPIAVNTLNAVLASLPAIARGVHSLMRGKLDVNVLDASALVVSLLRRDFRTAGLLTVLLGLGEMLESHTRKKSLSGLADQLSINVDSVWVVKPDGSREQRALQTVQLTDHVVVHAGNSIPVDGVVVEGEGSVNQASMTGEPLPAHRYPGACVFAGTVLEDGELVIRPTHIGEGTRLNQIIRFIESSESAKAAIQSKAEHLADRIVPFNFLLATLVYFFTRDFTRMASVLMVDFSCALRLATPLAILTAMRTGTQDGALIKGGRFLEALAEADTVIFDKTGTLTSSSPRLTDVISLNSAFGEDELLRLAACLEEHFPHPVGHAIVRAAEKRSLWHGDEKEHSQVKYFVAHGICSSVEGKQIVLGSRHFIEDDEFIDVSAANDICQELASEGKSILYLAVDKQLTGILGLEDPIRDEASEVIATLRSIGIKNILMLTGDDQRTAKAVAEELGIDQYHAGILPQDKARVVEELKAQGCRVLMIGDGVNDSPALSASDVGFTLRDGADIAQEVADVVITTNSLRELPKAILLGRATMRRIRQNFGLSVGLNSAFLATSLTGLMTPALGALLHNGTTIGVCFNAMRSPYSKTIDITEIAEGLSHSAAIAARAIHGQNNGAQHAKRSI